MKYEYKGQLYSVTKLANIAGMSRVAMSVRLGKFRTVEEAVETKKRHRFQMKDNKIVYSPYPLRYR